VADQVGDALADGPAEHLVDRGGQAAGGLVDDGHDVGGVQRRAGTGQLRGQRHPPVAADRLADLGERAAGHLLDVADLIGGVAGNVAR
jgi:hypothetical protein